MRLSTTLGTATIGAALALACFAPAQAGGWSALPPGSVHAYPPGDAQLYYVGGRTYGPYEYYGVPRFYPRYGYPAYKKRHWRRPPRPRYRAHVYYGPFPPIYYGVYGGDCYRPCRPPPRYHGDGYIK